MRLILLTCAIGLALSPLPASGQAPAGRGQIVGRVTDAGTNAPIAGARVMVSPVLRGPVDARGPSTPPMLPGEMLSSLTDENGRFLVDAVGAGRVRVSVQKPGFASNDALEMQTVEVRAGQQTHVDVALRRGGVVAGRVLDERGEPLSDIRVMALRRIPGRGDRLMMAGGPGSVTNDLGEFRVAGLAAGDYVLTGSAQPQPPFGGTAAGAKTTWAPTYYPGTTNQADAQVVTVPHGETVHGLELRLIPAPAFRVTGIAVDEAGKPVADAVVTLSAARLNPGNFSGPPAIGHATADGTFAIGGVIAGSYIVNASRMVRPGPGASGVTTMTFLGRGSQPQQEVQVDGADVTGLRVIVATPRQ